MNPGLTGQEIMPMAPRTSLQGIRDADMGMDTPRSVMVADGDDTTREGVTAHEGVATGLIKTQKEKSMGNIKTGGVTLWPLEIFLAIGLLLGGAGLLGIL